MAKSEGVGSVVLLGGLLSDRAVDLQLHWSLVVGCDLDGLGCDYEKELEDLVLQFLRSSGQCLRTSRADNCHLPVAAS